MCTGKQIYPIIQVHFQIINWPKEIANGEGLISRYINSSIYEYAVP